MDTRFLQYILVLAETGNMTKAAKKLYISQPTLSQFLARHETEIGTALFERKNGKYSLTPAGELYADYARLVLSLTEKLEKDIRKLCTTAPIVIATATSSALNRLVQILPIFCKAYPQVELTVMDHHTLQSVDAAIAKGEVDLAFAALPSPGVFPENAIELRREEVRLIVPAGHPAAQQVLREGVQRVTRADFDRFFAEIPMILQLPGTCIRYLIDAFLGSGHAYATVCHTKDARSICDMVANEIGIGFVPVEYLPQGDRIASFPLEPRMYRIHSILLRKDLERSEPVQLLIDLAQKHWAAP